MSTVAEMQNAVELLPALEGEVVESRLLVRRFGLDVIDDDEGANSNSCAASKCSLPGLAAGIRCENYAALPQHFLNFLPELHRHGSLRPTFGDSRMNGRTGASLSSHSSGSR